MDSQKALERELFTLLQRNGEEYLKKLLAYAVALEKAMNKK